MYLFLSVLLAAAPATTTVVVEEQVSLENWFKNEKDATKKTKYRKEALDRGLEQAKQQAVSRALEQAVASLSPGASANSLMAREQIYDRAGELVTVDSVTETHTEEQLKLQLKATVQLGTIEKELDDIKAKMARLGQKRVLLAVGEITLEPNGERAKLGSRHVLASVLGDLLRRDGWAIYDGTGRLESGDASREEIDRVGVELNVDQILTGTATYRRSRPSRNGVIPDLNDRGEQLNFFVHGDYAIELVDTGTWVKRVRLTGQLKQPSKSNVDMSQSYAATEVGFTQVAAPAVAAELRAQMLVMLSQLEESGLEIMVTLTKVDLGKVDDFEKRVKQLPKVKDVNLRGDFDGGKQAVEVRYTGTSNELATAITKAKGIRFSVVSVKKAQIELTAK